MIIGIIRNPIDLIIAKNKEAEFEELNKKVLQYENEISSLTAEENKLLAYLKSDRFGATNGK